MVTLRRPKRATSLGWGHNATPSGAAKTFDVRHPKAQALIKHHGKEGITVASEFFGKINGGNSVFGRTNKGSTPIAIEFLENLGIKNAVEFAKLVSNPRMAKALIEQVGYEKINEHFNLVKKSIIEEKTVAEIVELIG